MKLFLTSLILFVLFFISCNEKEENNTTTSELELKLKTFEENGDYNSAIQSFNDILKIEKHTLQVIEKAIEKAVNEGKTIEQTSENFHLPIQSYAVMLMENRRYEEALRILKAINDKDIYIDLCYIELKDYISALQHIELKVSDEVDFIDKQIKGYCLVKLGQIEKGKHMIIENLVHSGPNDPRVKLTEEEKTFLVTEKFFEIFPEKKSQVSRYVLTNQLPKKHGFRSENINL
jgi:tetratricopeptide (TPR) repeat protein